MEHFSYKGGCGILEHTCIKELDWDIDKQLQGISYINFGYTTKKIKNKDILNLELHIFWELLRGP